MSARDDGRGGPLAIDLQALQAPMSRGRGIGRYAEQLALALEEFDPTLVGAYLLNERFAPPALAEPILASGKVRSRAEGLPPGCAALHLLSPLDLAIPLRELWPLECDRRGIALSMTVYDLVPLTDASSRPAGPGERRRYRTRLQLLRHADQLQVLSRHVGEELLDRLGISPRRVRRVGAAAGAEFIPAPSRSTARAQAIAALSGAGLRRAFVFYPSGSHPRKNNETLIRAYARLAALRKEPPQLLLAAELDGPTEHHYRHLAERLGIAELLVLVGYLPDEVQLACLQGAEVVAFPSLAEGFALPVAEALACNTAVVASDRPPIDELVAPEWRFDPTDEQAIARAIDEALVRPEAARAPRSGSWPEVASRFATAARELFEHPPRRPRPAPSSRRQRPRIALVTPLPPAPTGVAVYSYRLAEAMLQSEKVTLDCFVEGDFAERQIPPGAGAHPVTALPACEGLTGAYDHIVYCVGNSHHHLGALRLLTHRPGVVLAHDVRLSNLYRHTHGDPSLRPGGFARALAAMYPELPSELGANGELAPETLERFGCYMAREVISSSRGFLVSSRAALELARVEAEGATADRLAILPFALGGPDARFGTFREGEREAPEGLGPAARRWGLGPPEGTSPLIVHFGIVDPVKEPERLLRALVEIRAEVPGVSLAFVGPLSDALADALAQLAFQLGIGDALSLTGPLSAQHYRAWLERATLAVQLRASFNGEASAAVGECLASGVPTVVSDLGWARDLPEGAVARIAPGASVGELAECVVSLIRDPLRRHELTAEGHRAAREASFAASARALLRYLEGSEARR